MDLQFGNAWILFLLWLIPPAIWVWRRLWQRRRTAVMRFIAADLHEKLVPDPDRRTRNGQAGLMAAAVVLLLLAASRPQWGTREETAFRRGRDVLVLLDVSRSMQATDVHPSRLQRAKMDLFDLVKDLRDDRVGLIAFWHGANLICPLTTDYTFLRQAVDGAGPHSAPRGETSLGAALWKALDIFGEDTGNHQAILMITDGEDLTGKGLEAARAAGQRGIPVFAVGLGSTRGSTIPDADASHAAVRYRGEDVVTRLDHDTLMAIREASDGAYIPIGTAGTASMTLGDLYKRHLRLIDSHDFIETLQSRRIERFQLFLLPALMALLAAAFLSPGRLAARAANPVSTVMVGLTLLGAVLAGTEARAEDTVPSQPAASEPAAPRPSGHAAAREAQRQFRAGLYEEAAALYEHAADSANHAAARQTYRYNAAIALARAGDPDAAQRLLRRLADQDEHDPAITAALGSTLVRSAPPPDSPGATNQVRRARLLHEAAEAFRQAAHASEDYETVLANLGTVLEALPQAETAARTAELLEQHADADAAALLGTLLAEQRRIAADTAGAMTNAHPDRIAELEALAERQRANSDLWVPLKPKLISELTARAEGDPDQQKNLARIPERIEQTQSAMRAAAQRLRDLDPDTQEAVRASEASAYPLWKAIAPFDAILQQDIWFQTNAIAAAQPSHAVAVAMQSEALDLTGLFTERFLQAVPPAEAASTGPADPDPGTGTGIDPETRAKILGLAAEARNIQQSALDHLSAGNRAAARPLQERAVTLLKEIEDLLPKQDQEQPDDSNEPPEEDDKDNSTESPKQEADDSAKPPDKQEADDTTPDEPKPEEEMPQDIQRMLERAIQREKEFETEKRKLQTVPASPWERDW